MLHLQEFIFQHNDWETLLSESPYNLKITYDDDYFMLKYNQLCSDFSNVLVQESRGIIFNVNTLKPVCHAFDKFMNAGESNSALDKIDWNNASVQEKVDGSLMKMWYDNGWHISTNGTIDAFKAPLNTGGYASYGKLFIDALPISFEVLTKELDPDYTYMFELVSPFNRVVINYQTPQLYFLGLRNNVTQKEEFPETCSLCKYFKIPKRYSLHTLQEVLDAASKLPWDEEGYVVCDKNFNRVKIKSPEYVKAHFARNNGALTDERLLEVILENEQSEFLVYASDYEARLKYLEQMYAKAINFIDKALKQLQPHTYEVRKDLAEEIKKYDKWLQPFLFAYDKIAERISKTRAAQWLEIFHNIEQQEEGAIKKWENSSC